MHVWRLRTRTLHIGVRPLILGIVNVTPDSFSDGGLFLDVDAAVTHGLKLVEQGADLLDVGGESTRPGSLPVPVDEEVRRVVPVIERLAKSTVAPISVDTSKAQVAAACLDAGAEIINDVTALTGDPDMVDVARRCQPGLILMHMRGTPATMQVQPHYDDAVNEIVAYLQERLGKLSKHGIALEQIALDPGIGFGKSKAHNLEILARLDEFQRLGRPLCLGVSRKGFIGLINKLPVAERVIGSIAAACHAVSRGAAQILRVHDVLETRQAVDVLAAIMEAGARGEGSGARASDP